MICLAVQEQVVMVRGLVFRMAQAVEALAVEVATEATRLALLTSRSSSSCETAI